MSIFSGTGSGSASDVNVVTAPSTLTTPLSNLDTKVGAVNSPAASSDAANDSNVIGFIKRLLGKLPSALQADRLKVDGSGVTQPVSGTFWQATQPVSGTFWQATQPVSGSVSVSNLPATQPISGSVSVIGTAQVSVSGTAQVSDRGATGQSTVSSFTSASSNQIALTNANRKLLTIYNEGPANLHVLYGAGTASTTNYSVRLSANDYIEINRYVGQINAIFAASGSTARITEIT